MNNIRSFHNYVRGTVKKLLESFYNDKLNKDGNLKTYNPSKYSPSKTTHLP